MPQYEGYYQVSNTGLIKSLTRKAKVCGGSYRIVQSRILRTIVNKDKACFINLSGKRKSVPRLIAQAFLSDYSEKLHVDHIDGNRVNNHISNLRMLSCADNQIAFKKKNFKCTSKYRGVSLHRLSKKWQVHISKNGIKHSVGLFENEDDAALAYNKKATELNFLPESLNIIK